MAEIRYKIDRSLEGDYVVRDVSTGASTNYGKVASNIPQDIVAQAYGQNLPERPAPAPAGFEFDWEFDPRSGQAIGVKGYLNKVTGETRPVTLLPATQFGPTPEFPDRPLTQAQLSAAGYTPETVQKEQEFRKFLPTYEANKLPGESISEFQHRTANVSNAPTTGGGTTSSAPTTIPSAITPGATSLVPSPVSSPLPTAQPAPTPQLSQIPQNVPVTQPEAFAAGGESQYIQFDTPSGPAYFQKTAQGLAAVNDPAVLNQLRSGQIKATRQTSFTGGTSGTVATPSLVPQPTGVSFASAGNTFGGEQTALSGGQTTFNDVGLQSFTKDFNLSAPTITDNPISWLKTAYEKFYTDLGLGSVKTRISNITKEIEDVDTKLADEIADINANPWLSEGERSRQVSKLQEKFEGRRNAVVNRLRLEESIYGDARQEAEFFLGKAFDFQQNMVIKAMDFAERRASIIEKEPDTPALREYRAVKAEGTFSGGFMDFLKAREQQSLGSSFQTIGNQIMHFVTDKQGNIVGTSVIGPSSNVFSAEAIRNRSNALSGLRAVATVRQMLQADPSLLAKALIPGSLFARKFSTAKNEMVDVIARLRSGAVLNRDEEAFYRGQLPGIRDLTDPGTIEYKLNLFDSLFNDLAGKTQPSVGGQPSFGGGQPSPQLPMPSSGLNQYFK